MESEQKQCPSINLLVTIYFFFYVRREKFTSLEIRVGYIILLASVYTKHRLNRWRNIYRIGFCGNNSCYMVVARLAEGDPRRGMKEGFGYKRKLFFRFGQLTRVYGK